MSAWVILGWIYSSGMFYFGGYITRARLDQKYDEQKKKELEKDCFMAGYLLRGKEDMQIYTLTKESLENESKNRAEV